MNYRLTKEQQDAVRWIHQAIAENRMRETFYVWWTQSKGHIGYPKHELTPPFALKRGFFDLLHAAGFIIKTRIGKSKISCTITGDLEHAVVSGFPDTPAVLPISTLAHSHPPEIALSIDRLRTKFPDPKKMGFLIMRFAAEKAYRRIVDTIQKTASEYDLQIVRADENEFHADLWGNVRTHLHGCGFAIAVYERIQTDEPNANIGLEVGYLMSMNKPVLLLKDKTLPTLQADLAGKLYKTFDPHAPERTIPRQLIKWLQDNGIVVTT